MRPSPLAQRLYLCATVIPLLLAAALFLTGEEAFRPAAQELPKAAIPALLCAFSVVQANLRYNFGGWFVTACCCFLIFLCYGTLFRQTFLGFNEWIQWFFIVIDTAAFAFFLPDSTTDRQEENTEAAQNAGETPPVRVPFDADDRQTAVQRPQPPRPVPPPATNTDEYGNKLWLRLSVCIGVMSVLPLALVLTVMGLKEVGDWMLIDLMFITLPALVVATIMESLKVHRSVRDAMKAMLRCCLVSLVFPPVMPLVAVYVLILIFCFPGAPPRTPSA